MDSFSRSFGLMRDVLLQIRVESSTIDLLSYNMTSSSSLKTAQIESVVRLAKRFGFVRDEGVLSLTKEGNSFCNHLTSLQESKDELENVHIIDESSISITLPPFCRALPLDLKNEIAFTSETIRHVMRNASRKMYVVSPLLNHDLFQSFFENIRPKPNAVITILTSERKLTKFQNGPMGNLILEEIGKLLKSRFKYGRIYYMEKDMSISHAKIFCSDKSLLVTSANVKKNSISENFELGIYTERQDLIRNVTGIIEHLLEHGKARCIYDTEVGVI